MEKKKVDTKKAVEDERCGNDARRAYKIKVFLLCNENSFCFCVVSFPNQCCPLIRWSRDHRGQHTHTAHTHTHPGRGEDGGDEEGGEQ